MRTRRSPRPRQAIARAAVALALLAAPGAVARAQTVLLDGGNAADVQAAVDTPGVATVLLRGSFAFDNSSVTISQSVRVAGVADDVGASPTVNGGVVAFAVAAPGASVALEGLHFVESQAEAIAVDTVGDLEVTGCFFDGVVPQFDATVGQVVAIAIFSPGGGPTGTISIVGNDFDIRHEKDASGAVNSTNGLIWSGPTAAIEISGNTVEHVTGHGFDLRGVGGLARVARNVVRPGPIGRSGGARRFNNGIRCVEDGSYVVEQNVIACESRSCAGVRLGGTTGALVQANDITMSVPGAAPGQQSAAIQVEGSAVDNAILENTIRGSALCALSVAFSDFVLDMPPGTTGKPDGTTFVGNNHEEFVALSPGLGLPYADVMIGLNINALLLAVPGGTGASGTTVISGSGTIIDNGVGTIVKGDYSTTSGAPVQTPGGVGATVSDAASGDF